MCVCVYARVKSNVCLLMCVIDVRVFLKVWYLVKQTQSVGLTDSNLKQGRSTGFGPGGGGRQFRVIVNFTSTQPLLSNGQIKTFK